jgi:hypothetical protein
VFRFELWWIPYWAVGWEKWVDVVRADVHEGLRLELCELAGMGVRTYYTDLT